MKNYCALLIMLLMLACQSKQQPLPYYDTPDFTPRWDIPNGKDFHKIRPFSLINQNNQTFTEKDIEDKICVVDFFFTTCPGICPKLAKSMADIQKEFLADDELLLLSHSVMPDVDSVPVLQAYANEKKVNFKRWKLLTGSKKEIYDLGRKYYFVEEDEGISKSDDIFLHTENFILIDKERHIRGIYNGLDPSSIQSLISDIHRLKQE
ncbi:MAG: SCO family protein [Chitinophagaceae bacterium]|nr:SCO family protein [Chitinophagaceae bacterium]